MARVDDVAGFPAFEVKFDRLAALVDGADPAALAAWVDAQKLNDLLVFSHGWNNDIADARDLGHHLFGAFRAVLTAHAELGPAARRFGVLLLFWPSKRFTESSLIPGGVASADDGDLPAAALQARLDELSNDFFQGEAPADAGRAFDHPNAAGLIAEARGLVPNVADVTAARTRFGELARALSTTGDDGGKTRTTGAEDGPIDRGRSGFLELGGKDLVELLQSAPAPAPAARSTGDAGGAAGIVDTVGGAVSGAASWLYNGARAGAERLLNYSTYYQMKIRAGLVGRDGLNPLLAGLAAGRPALNLHLIGHSFGARVVTAAACGSTAAAPLKPATLSLLQAAFSQYGFARDYDPNHADTDGMFLRVVADQCVRGPMLVTHTVNDQAVGIAYAIASRLSGEAGAAVEDWVGGPTDFFGGLGRNGALKTPGCVSGLALQFVGGTYQFTRHVPHNLKADAYISEHNDIAKPEVAYAVLSAVAQTPPPGAGD